MTKTQVSKFKFSTSKTGEAKVYFWCRTRWISAPAEIGNEVLSAAKLKIGNTKVESVKQGKKITNVYIDTNIFGGAWR